MEAITDQLHSLKIDPAKCEVKFFVNRVYSASAKRYHENAEYRETVKATSRARRQLMTPEQKEANKKRVLDKYHNDPVYQANALLRAQERRARKKEENARLKANRDCNTIVNL
jgi:hypothetical protein